MLNVEMQTYTYIGSTIVQIYYTILADIVRHRSHDQLKSGLLQYKTKIKEIFF